MEAWSRHDRRAQATRVRLAEKNRAKLVLFVLGVFVLTKTGKLSRKSARRLVEAETVRRFGKYKAKLMGPRLPPAKPRVSP